MHVSPLDQLSPMTWTRPDGYQLSTARERISFAVVDQFLRNEAYWAGSYDAQTLKRALAGSVVIGAYAPDGEMAGFGRLVTDCAVFAYLRDVFVLKQHRGKRLAVWMAAQIREHPGLEDVKTWMLATKDAHAVYEKAGYEPVPYPEWYMSVPKQAKTS